MGKSKSTISDGASFPKNEFNDSQKLSQIKNISKGFYRGADQNSK